MISHSNCKYFDVLIENIERKKKERMKDKAGISEISGLGGMDNCWEKGTNERRNIGRGFSIGNNYNWFFYKKEILGKARKLGSYYLFNHVLCKILEKLMVIVWFKSLWRDVNYLDLFQSFFLRFFFSTKMALITLVSFSSLFVFLHCSLNNMLDFLKGPK